MISRCDVIVMLRAGDLGEWVGSEPSRVESELDGF